jgi:membrane-bound inhibitor of C-type lysozyme
MALPADSVLEVAVTDADGVVLGSQTTSVVGQPPVPFELVDSRRGAVVFLRAEIADPDGRALWRTPGPVAVESTRDARSIELLLVRVAEQAETDVWVCGDRALQVRYATGVADLYEPHRLESDLAGEEATRLWLVISASGARYSDGVTELWIKGPEATLRRDGETLSCRSSVG